MKEPWQLPPDWETARGGGPVTDWMRDREMLEQRRLQRERRLNDPTTIEDPPRTHNRRDGMSYEELREKGLCTRCAKPADGAVCWACNQVIRANRRARRKKRWG